MHKILKKRRIEWFVFFAFIIVYIMVSIFHEPWFDEAQAWQIAKCANINDIFFTIPHYEGHPPLWHLILAVPAKLGVPFEIGLKSIGFIISAASVFLLLFNSQLPRMVRLLLPFSYFFFYQYGIVVRPYCLMLLVMILLGINYNRWNCHPWIVIILLSILCLTCAYGIVLAGGIALCLVCDLFLEKGLTSFIRDLFKDKRLLALLFLLIIAILIIFNIFPRKDTFSSMIQGKNPLIKCIACSLFIFPLECFLTTTSWFSIDRVLLQNANISNTELLLFLLIGIFFWFFIICVSTKRNLKLLFFPYFLFAMFSAAVYFSCHHLGIVFIFFVFWFEVQFQDSNCFEMGKNISLIIARTERDHQLIQKMMKWIGFVCLIIPVCWSISASFADIRTNYCFGRETAEFIKKNDLDDKLILAQWSVEGSEYAESEGHDDYINPNIDGIGTLLSAYFSQNMSLCLNNKDDDKAYTFYKKSSYKESQENIIILKEQGVPDLILGKPRLELVYGKELDYSDYSLVKIIHFNYIWKTGKIRYYLPIFMHNSLISQYEMNPITGIDEIMINGFTITEEMKEQFENGVSVEEILKPYLDAMFGEEKK